LLWHKKNAFDWCGSKGKASAPNIPADERFGPINYFFEEYDPKYFPLWAKICPVWPELFDPFSILEIFTD
jgi:hypothetical protein